MSPLPKLYAQPKKCGVNINADPAPAYQAGHGKMVALVGSMIGLHTQLAAAKSAAQRAIIERQIDATDGEIDLLVYDLYGLTAEEIALVEGAGP